MNTKICHGAGDDGEEETRRANSDSNHSIGKTTSLEAETTLRSLSRWRERRELLTLLFHKLFRSRKRCMNQCRIQHNPDTFIDTKREIIITEMTSITRNGGWRRCIADVVITTTTD